MCSGGKPDIPNQPKADPKPTIQPEEASPSGQAETRKKRTEQYRQGFASTIKTSPVGLQDENTPGLGTKTKLGQ